MSRLEFDGSEKKDIKVLLIGLENSGKTSIALSLDKKTNILSYFHLKPTPGLNIVRIREEDSNIHIWDLGGQKMYRDEYLRDLQKYVDGADEIIYVIDIQDKDRYDTALDYLKKLVDFLKSRNNLPGFNVFLHKFDPDLYEIKEFASREVSSQLLARIRKVIPKNISYDVFETCIYSMFQKNLIQKINAEK